jgi:hypothetical protein
MASNLGDGPQGVKGAWRGRVARAGWPWEGARLVVDGRRRHGQTAAACRDSIGGLTPPVALDVVDDQGPLFVAGAFSFMCVTLQILQ